MAAAAFLIRDRGVPGHNIPIYAAAPVSGGSLDGGGNPTAPEGGRYQGQALERCRTGLTIDGYDKEMCAEHDKDHAHGYLESVHRTNAR